MSARHRPLADYLGRRRFPGGQASIEYIVVLAFGVMVLLKPFGYADVSDPNAAKTEAPALQQLAKAIKDYHKDYTYALAIATIPDCDYTYSTSLADWTPTEIATYFPSMPNITATVGVDRCIDWQHPALPTPTLDISPFPTLPASFGDAIKTIVTDAVDKAVNDLLKPENIASAIGFPISLPF